MPLVIPKSVIEGAEAVPAAVYDLRIDGFKPKFSEKKDSINLNPALKIVGTDNPDIDEKRIFFNMNTNFGPGIVDLVHGCGLEMVKVGDDYAIPGDFGKEDDPTKWNYTGPLLGKTFKAEVIQTPQMDGNKPKTDAKGVVKMRNEIKVIFCTVPGCEVVHSKSLSGTK